MKDETIRFGTLELHACLVPESDAGDATAFVSIRASSSDGVGRLALSATEWQSLLDAAALLSSAEQRVSTLVLAAQEWELRAVKAEAVVDAARAMHHAWRTMSAANLYQDEARAELRNALNALESTKEPGQ